MTKTSQSASRTQIGSLLGLFERSLKDVKVVSFDVFDTLLYRYVFKPTDIFILAQLEARYKYKIKVPEDLFLKRIQAEQKAREFYIKKDREDITLDEIYEFLPLLYPGFSPRQIGVLKNIELRLESKFNTAHPIGKMFFDTALRLGKRVIVTSDMYLPASAIARLLKKAGYNSLVRIRVSSEIKKGKYTGNLYKKLLREEKISPHQLLHVGDNLVSDVAVPSRLGIRTLYLPQVKNILPKAFPSLLEWKKSLEGVGYPLESYIVKSIIWGIIARSLLTGMLQPEKDIQKTGRVVANLYTFPPLVDYTLWIMKTLRERKIPPRTSLIAFLSRDNYLMSRLYDALKELREFNKLPVGKYVYSSRRLYIFPSSLLSRQTDEAIFYIATGKPGTTVKNILDRLSVKIPSSLIKKSLARAGLSYKSDVFENFQKVIYFVYSLLPYLTKEAKREFYVLSSYFRKKLKKTLKNVVVSDLGWSGSMIVNLARLLRKIYKRKIKPIGFMLGVDIRRSKQKKIEQLGGNLYIYSTLLKNQEDMMLLHDAGVEVVENLFPAPHGTVINLSYKGKKIVANEGKVPPKNREKYKVIINEVGKLTETFSTLIPRFDLTKYQPDPNFYLYPLLNLLKLKDTPIKVLKWVATIQHSAGWGNDQQYNYIAFPSAYNLSAIYKDYQETYWKQAFVKFIPAYLKPVWICYYYFRRLLKKFSSLLTRLAKKGKLLYNKFEGFWRNILHLPATFKARKQEKRYLKVLEMKDR